MAIRDNRIAAESIGINVTKYKLLAFTVSRRPGRCGGSSVLPQSFQPDGKQV